MISTETGQENGLHADGQKLINLFVVSCPGFDLDAIYSNLTKNKKEKRVNFFVVGKVNLQVFKSRISY